ncbi:MAG: 50S ribosomal protein L32e [Candidatus Micrarchaeota archaeon]|nr:50S ribosomal protein L32e [Candidatus Micrarchaeota archaeon]
MVSKRKHPKFLRPNYGRSSRSRVSDSWRRPRGIDNKKRLKLAYMGASPSIGYRQPSQVRGKHPLGLPEVLVQSPSELASLKGVAVRIASGVGALKRDSIQKLAEKMGLVILNPKKFIPRLPKPKDKKAEQKKEEHSKVQQKKSEEAAEEAKASQMPKAEGQTGGQQQG